MPLIRLLSFWLSDLGNDANGMKAGVAGMSGVWEN